MTQNIHIEHLHLLANSTFFVNVLYCLFTYESIAHINRANLNRLTTLKVNPLVPDVH